MQSPSSENLTDQEWVVIDRTIIMVGLMLTEAMLLKSGYPQDIQQMIMLRIQHLLQKMGVSDE